MSTREHFVLN